MDQAICVSDGGQAYETPFPRQLPRATRSNEPHYEEYELDTTCTRPPVISPVNDKQGTEYSIEMSGVTSNMFIISSWVAKQKKKTLQDIIGNCSRVSQRFPVALFWDTGYSPTDQISKYVMKGE